MKKVILASASPRRKALLEQIGLDFTIESSPYKEPAYKSEDPRKFVEKQSYEKAKAVAKNHTTGVIIGADTIVLYGDTVMEKPNTAQNARAMLRHLSGNSHTVLTGYTLIDALTGKSITETSETTVFIKKLSDAEIDWYIETGEPLDKAGAYGIQEKGALLVERIEGDYFNVVGLPLVPVLKALKRMGIDYFSV